MSDKTCDDLITILAVLCAVAAGALLVSVPFWACK